MAILCELLYDRDRGPGHGLVKIAGLGPTLREVDFTLMRNHGSDPFLGPGGKWQSTEYLHHARVSSGETPGRIVIPAGPELVDPIVEQPSSVAYRLTVALANAKHVGTLKVHRPLLGSKAAGSSASRADDTQATVPDNTVADAAAPSVLESPAPPPSEPAVIEPGFRSELDQPLDIAPPPPKKSKVPIFAGALFLPLALGIGLWMWWDCRIPVVAPKHCPEASADGGPEHTDTVPPAPGQPSKSPNVCTGLQADDCLALGLKELAAQHLEPARQLFQQAARLGSAKANLELAKMYDPDTWSAEHSPVERPDWETASYWYEEAARQGEPEGVNGAGRLYCRFATDPVFRERGLALLRKAATASGAGQPLLQECEAKSQ